MHPIDCNLADEEYVVIPDQVVDPEGSQDHAAEDIPSTPTPEGKLRAPKGGGVNR